MRSIVEYLKQDKEFNVTGFKIIDKNNEDIISSWGDGDLLKAIHELNKLRNEDPNAEYWLMAVINNDYYDLDDPGNYLVLKSYEYNEKDDHYGINPKFNAYLI
jgi:hypothetical protein